MTAGNTAIVLISTMLLSAGAFLLLPHRHGRAKPLRVHALGAILAALGVVAFASLWVEPFPKPSGAGAASQWLTQVFFYAFGAVAISAAIMAVVSRNPVHNALWFAVVLLATAGLFLLVDAQFLAAGTVIVYAGAIVVMFLFVIMLAQSEGYALYDRMARAPLMTSVTAMLLLGSLAYAICSVRVPLAPSTPGALNSARTEAPRFADLVELAQHGVDDGASSVLARQGSANLPATANIPHVASLGAALYSDHLITVEVAGALLFVALVAAAAIATPRSHTPAPIRGVSHP